MDLTLKPFMASLKELMDDRDDEVGVVISMEGRGAEHRAEGGDEEHEV